MVREEVTVELGLEEWIRFCQAAGERIVFQAEEIV